MALKHPAKTVHGFSAPDAYHRVECPEISFDRKTLIFSVRTYKEGGKDLPAFGDVRLECPYDMDGPNPFKQAYQYLGTLPEYKGATVA